MTWNEKDKAIEEKKDKNEKDTFEKAQNTSHGTSEVSDSLCYTLNSNTATWQNKLRLESLIYLHSGDKLSTRN
jgi:hypothetical protein